MVSGLLLGATVDAVSMSLSFWMNLDRSGTQLDGRIEKEIETSVASNTIGHRYRIHNLN